ncbi:uncharacterized protein LOC114940873 [Nylanderia fulva]|uniref:uncharacterized protein LOC114940873 n=1 Tax=Nylanderia fulva TaxID=613905 RepID=UPI0010FB12C8|nr:uncharacterized protein LOC114940873 [Nylanderia fulva]XP_029171474.1 uncharacterized protein LOC114940873 [Nylanderia fulva]XP_029171475.1 uncharacterized protein LOC114940873 [Nylanderia fulva]XP_029171476.1 uncharacterized protein LOC114940873 [Nylanderia fulva]
MNRLEDSHIRFIRSSFYKNVCLLTQMVLPSNAFQQHFRQGMFDKPNTAGFLHVSHYLSIVYDATLFNQIVNWPILCKKDEVTYRFEIKNFLSILSQDNPDINFPSILLSHLIQSGGSKFLIIMWKLSQVALKSYLKREFQGELCDAPRTGPVDDVTVTYFNNVIAKKCSIITETHEETQKILDTATTFYKNEIEILNTYKSEIFDRKEDIERLALNTLMSSFIQKRLIDVEDINIISLWRRNISEKMQYIYKENKKLIILKESCNRLYKLVLKMNTNSGILDANKFPKINYNNFLLEQSTINTINNLYTDGSTISFFTLLTLLYLTFIRMLYHINAADFSDLSPCLLFIQNVCYQTKFLQMLFNALNNRINSIYRDEQYYSRENKNAYTNADTINKLVSANCKILQSPKINFNLNKCVDDNLLYEKLCSSVKEKDKDLFKRYRAQKYRPSHELSTALSDFNNSWSNMSGWLSPCKHSIKRKQVLVNGKPLSPLNLKRSRENILYSSSVSYEGLNLTPRKRRSISKI